MKRTKDYVPKYSLSIAYLKKIMGKKELKDLIEKYVSYKKLHWGDYHKKK